MRTDVQVVIPEQDETYLFSEVSNIPVVGEEVSIRQGIDIARFRVTERKWTFYIGNPGHAVCMITGKKLKGD